MIWFRFFTRVALELYKKLGLVYEDTNADELKAINTVLLCYSAIRAWRLCVQYSVFPVQLRGYCLSVVRKLAADGGTDYARPAL